MCLHRHAKDRDRRPDLSEGLGIAIPETGNRIGTLWVEVRLGSEVEAVVRTTTVVPEGRAGLAYLGVAEEEGFEEAVYLCGLRQNGKDRSNVPSRTWEQRKRGDHHPDDGVFGRVDRHQCPGA